MVCKYCNEALPDDSEFCQYCGKKIKEEFSEAESIEGNTIVVTNETSAHMPKAEIRQKCSNSKLINIINISAIVLSCLSIVAIIFAMCFQGEEWAFWEFWDPLIIYSILIATLGSLFVLAIVSLIQKKMKAVCIVAACIMVATIIFCIEGSVISTYYVSPRYEYANAEMVTAFNVIWISCIGVLFTIVTITALGNVIRILTERRHKSIRYREKCYKRVAKMQEYFEKGIITQEEFEKNKNEILKNIVF